MWPLLPVASTASSSGKKRKREDTEIREVPGERCQRPTATPSLDLQDVEWNLRMNADCTSIPDWDSDAQHARECDCDVCTKFYSDLAKSVILEKEILS